MSASEGNDDSLQACSHPATTRQYTARSRADQQKYRSGRMSIRDTVVVLWQAMSVWCAAHAMRPPNSNLTDPSKSHHRRISNRSTESCCCSRARRRLLQGKSHAHTHALISPGFSASRRSRRLLFFCPFSPGRFRAARLTGASLLLSCIAYLPVRPYVASRRSLPALGQKRNKRPVPSFRQLGSAATSLDQWTVLIADQSSSELLLLEKEPEGGGGIFAPVHVLSPSTMYVPGAGRRGRAIRSASGSGSACGWAPIPHVAFTSKARIIRCPAAACGCSIDRSIDRSASIVLMILQGLGDHDIAIIAI